MTLIECFDRVPLENIVGCLRLRPQKLFFLGDETLMRRPVERYRAFLAERGMDTEVVLRNVRMEDIADITAVLANIIQTEKECVIDVTGGQEQVILAVGAVLAELDDRQRKNVTVQKFDLFSGGVRDCDGDGKVISGNSATLTARELIALHGGVIHPRTPQPDPRYSPADLQSLWSMVSADPRSWNRAITVLKEFESRSESKTEIYLPLNAIAGGIANFGEKLSSLWDLLRKLHACGVIKDRSDANTLRYTYIDPLLQYCVKKAGNALEMKALLEARSLRHNGQPFFHDCQTSVNIDWDGIVHDPEQRIPETRNEVDLILMRGMIPLFVSCKNGNIGEEELYKLNTVAARFGSHYARKLLIAAELERKGPEANYAFIQRAKDMNIHLVTDAAALSSEDWQRVLKNAMGE